MDRIATPRTMQFVVISGRNIPRAWYIIGDVFLSIISTIWTSEAITRMKTTVIINSSEFGTRSFE